MKVIFLDFDGVLNTEKYVKARAEFGVIIDPVKMLLLKQIVEKTSAEIVLSTSWREHWDKNSWKCDDTGKRINEIFAQFNLKIFDKTPQLRLKREEEIRLWLNVHREVVNFVVLDDMLLSAEFLEGHFVKTYNYSKGLDEQAFEKAVEILNLKGETISNE